MNARVKRLKQESLEAVPRISLERAQIVTEAYKKYQGKVSIPVLRALIFKELCEKKTICINEGELIVGERGPLPKATPTYPELCCHSVEDLQTIDRREKVFFRVDDESIRIQKEDIIPFWKGKSMRDLLFNQMTEEWKDCYSAGIFTEFMEQRAPGHTVGDNKIFNKGFLDFKKEIENEIGKLDFINDIKAYDKNEQLKAMAICCDAIITFGKRHGLAAKRLADLEGNPVRKQELLEIAEVCNYVPANKPRNFREALQAYWFVHLSVITELNTWDAFSPGRLDQHLYPYYKQGIKDGSLTREKAKELLQLFWIKFNNQPAPPKVGVTLQESGTYTDFANISCGGVKSDGNDGVNEVSYIILEVIDEMKLVQPSTNIQLSAKNSNEFLKAAINIIKKGWGQPSIFNTETIIEEMLRVGKSIEDARCGGTSGCVETGAFGKEAYILTGYLNLVKILEITLNNGVDPLTKKVIGIRTGNPREFESFNQLMEAYRKQVNHFVEIKIRGNNIIERLYQKYMPSPFLSVIIDDCIKNGEDYNAGGARYNSMYIQGVGIGTLTDSLSSIKYHIYDNKNLTIDELLKVLKNNFEGEERIRQLLLNKTPRYGNDDDYADDLMIEAFNIFYNEVNGRPSIKGGNYRINMLPTTCHVYFGSVTGATPDGRKAYEPQSEGISPVQGTDRLGPTSVIKSASKMDHIKTGGTLLNQKFTPSLLEDEKGIKNLMYLIRTYFKLGGHHIQFNVVNADMLKDAQLNPDEYKDLIVRVAGYSDYFNDLNEGLQNEIIARTEHKEF
ncbi:trans-4-hydroxy-L-proline dehydratase [Clostridium sp. Cult2]|uniref:trans-4-hydroxy-L-proline dehydratase n=1 Tax=Clostridium sp. Cult2 TaxID=2079003 RepID=UPI001F45461B|nr:trans-4-hydroxy-L-proline dehydratase [Clostridium sp. Cult2]MCF6464514.1 formate C-acetyltransferase/glycerol dehydratase family glycyl radical enzyme [Clostridium sp. Cult2]